MKLLLIVFITLLSLISFASAVPQPYWDNTYSNTYSAEHFMRGYRQYPNGGGYANARPVAA